MLNIAFVESALELIPKEIRGSAAVVSDSKRRGLPPGEILLDRSFHHSAMIGLKDSEKRGRPDLVHLAVLSVTGTPFYLEGKARVFVHTCRDVVIEIAPKTRMPKNYLRFRGLMEKTLLQKPDEGLVRASEGTLRQLVGSTSSNLVVGLSVLGRPVGLEELARRIGETRDSCVMIGGFPHGHFSDDTLGVVKELVRVHPRPLEAHVVASRLVYEAEKALAGIND